MINGYQMGDPFCFCLLKHKVQKQGSLLTLLRLVSTVVWYTNERRKKGRYGTKAFSGTADFNPTWFTAFWYLWHTKGDKKIHSYFMNLRLHTAYCPPCLSSICKLTLHGGLMGHCYIKCIHIWILVPASKSLIQNLVLYVLPCTPGYVRVSHFIASSRYYCPPCLSSIRKLTLHGGLMGHCYMKCIHIWILVPASISLF